MWVVLSACSKGHDPDRLARAAALNHAIASLRQAPNSGKRQYLKLLRQLPCDEDLSCEVKQVCASAYAAHVAALDDVNAAKKSIGTVHPTSLATRLEQARSELVLAEKSTQACVSRQVHLQKHYGLDR